MPSRRVSASERARLDALERYGILDTAPEQPFDDLARIAATLCNAPLARIAFVDAAREWSKATIGPAPHELPRRRGFAMRTLVHPGPLIVPDIAADESLAERAAAYGEPAVRFFAGVSLVTGDGYAIGALCVFDHAPRTLSLDQVEALGALARQVVAQLELRRELPARLGDPELRDRAESFRRLATAANEGITIIVDDRIVEANHAFSALFGYDMAEIIGRSPLNFVAAESRDVAAQYVTISSDKPYEARGQRRNGSTFDIEVTTKSIPYKGRTALGCVVRDISERKEVDRLKNEFVSIVSHELRTPLTSIRGSLGLMEGGAVGELPAKARELLRVARQNADRLIRLINDILDLEKIESGKIQLHVAALDPVEIVESTIAELSAMALQYKVTLESTVERHDRIAGDRDRVVQVLTNLLSNAIKFSPEGGTVTVAISDGGAGFLRFLVGDQGPGIPEDKLTRLFVRFEQLESANTRRRGGTGLGLAISRSLVEQQGGRIGVDSSPGNGSTFWFELPFVRADGSTAPSDISHGILVVEDDPAVARVLVIMLQRDGHPVISVGSLEHARRVLDRGRPAAILLDMELPDGSGFQLLDYLVAIERLHDVPVVVLSGARPAADHQDARIVEWLTKPFAEQELRRAVRAALGPSDAADARNKTRRYA